MPTTLQGHVLGGMGPGAAAGDESQRQPAPRHVHPRWPLSGARCLACPSYILLGACKLGHGKGLDPAHKQWLALTRALQRTRTSANKYNNNACICLARKKKGLSLRLPLRRRSIHLLVRGFGVIAHSSPTANLAHVDVSNDADRRGNRRIYLSLTGDPHGERGADGIPAGQGGQQPSDVALRGARAAWERCPAQSHVLLHAVHPQ